MRPAARVEKRVPGTTKWGRIQKISLGLRERGILR